MHHIDLESSGGETYSGDPKTPWYRELNRYHWFVLIVAALGWLFDCLDQQLFVVTRVAAMRDLLPGVASAKAEPAVGNWRTAAVKGIPVPEDKAAWDKMVKIYSDYATSAFLAGWALGGLIFGMLGDRIGRARVMLLTIVLYSIFTGLSAISQGFWDFCLFRFLTGLGVGGEFAVGVALVAEVMPARARPYALTLLQMLSALGNISAALINMGFGIAEGEGLITSPWRPMFVIGALPALLALAIRSRLQEPDKWKQAAGNSTIQEKLGSYSQMFGHPTWRRHALAGMVLASAGVVGLWAIGFYAPDLTDNVMGKGITARVYDDRIAAAQAKGDAARESSLRELFDAVQPKEGPPRQPPEHLAEVKKEMDAAVKGKLTVLRGVSSICVQVGAFLGMFGFGMLAQRIGRKPTFVIAYLAAYFSTVGVFLYLSEFHHLFWMLPIMGFCQLSLFAGYAVYFPELFPTSLRSTGTSFCYNVGRIVAALGPLVKAYLTQSQTGVDALRMPGVWMSSVFLMGLFALFFLPETRGKPLPE